MWVAEAVFLHMKNLYKNLPDTPGVYLMKNRAGELLYVGKAGNLKRRVSSYFLRPHDARIQNLVSHIAKVEYRKTDTALEALILEAELIKEFSPPFNIKDKDGKSFLYFEITKDKFPRVLLVRGKDEGDGTRYGPFTSASSAREALKILRRIFPWSTHLPEKIGVFERGCFDFEVGLCPGTCVDAITREEYAKNIKNLKLFFEGKKKIVTRNLEKEMAAASKRLEFEKAEKFRRRIFALRHIHDIALINENDVASNSKVQILNSNYRIEGYDISNISGTSAVGSMVVFTNGEPNKNEYRKFKIRTVVGSNDVGMLKEVLRRRFDNKWQLPNLILIDGGRGQVSAAKAILLEVGLKTPIIGIAKGAKRKRNDIIGFVPKWTDKKTLVHVRDEAHRFAIGYHKKVRGREFLGSQQRVAKLTS
jgi:excinuclease ABC subunit C